MKKGNDIKEMVKQINDDADNKQDYIVNLKSLSTLSADSFLPKIKASNLDMQLTGHALSQLCGKLEIGNTYINKCLPVSQSLVIENLNFWIKATVTKDRDLMIRSFAKNDQVNCRAILSNRYKRIDNVLVATHSLNKLMDLGATLKYSYYDGNRMNITAVLPKLAGEVKKGDIVQGGITIANSEIGDGSLIIEPFIYRLVCTNGMVVPRILNKFHARHIGKIVIDPSNDDQAITIIKKMHKNSKMLQKKV